MLGDIGLPELLVIFIIVLVLFGPGKLPDVGKAIGEALRGFKKALKEPDKTIAERSNDKDEKWTIELVILKLKKENGPK